MNALFQCYTQHVFWPEADLKSEKDIHFSSPQWITNVSNQIQPTIQRKSKPKPYELSPLPNNIKVEKEKGNP